MYIGRIVSVAMTQDEKLAVAYRVSSRSFPNRTAVLHEDRISIIPRPGHEEDLQRNPYIAYNCLRVVCDGEVAVVSNGSQTDPIAEKMEAGMGARDALAFTSLVMDYEKDSYQTPRISGIVDTVDGTAWLGIVRHDGIEVRRLPMRPGHLFYVATYEENFISEALGCDFTGDSADSLCDWVLGNGLFSERTHPVTAAAGVYEGGGFSLAAKDAAQ